MFFRTVFRKRLETRFGNNGSHILKSVGVLECTVFCSNLTVLGYLCQELMWVHVRVYIYILTCIYSNIELGRIINYCYKITSQHTLVILVTTISVRKSASTKMNPRETQMRYLFKNVEILGSEVFLGPKSWLQIFRLKYIMWFSFLLMHCTFRAYVILLGSISCKHVVNRKYYEELL